MQTACSKIVATIGPASESPLMIGKLIAAGVDVFRLNFSHGTHETHLSCLQGIRKAAADIGTPVAILQDLQGPRIRTGKLSEKTCELANGAEITLRAGDFTGDKHTIAVSYENFATDVRPGDPVLLSDGTIELVVIATDGVSVTCRVMVGGQLGEHKGINLPGSSLSISSPTEKDLEDLRFGLEHGVDYVALSFVEKADDILRLRKAMQEVTGARPLPVIPKIERPVAVENLEDILRVSNGVMVARGDLGIEMPTETLPGVQKKIINTANRLGIPVITATQMLDSMIRLPRPTRAEASDVANAILDGTDAVMLSGETSIGKYPVETVKIMNRICREAEKLRRHEFALEPPAMEHIENTSQAAMARAACDIAARLSARAIVAYTMTGSTARCISQRRPTIPIYAFTPDEPTLRRMSLLWGVTPVLIDAFATTDEMIEQGGTLLLGKGLAEAGDTVVYIAGGATNTPGGTDMLKIHRFTR